MQIFVSSVHFTSFNNGTKGVNDFWCRIKCPSFDIFKVVNSVLYEKEIIKRQRKEVTTNPLDTNKTSRNIQSDSKKREKSSKDYDRKRKHRIIQLFKTLRSITECIKEQLDERSVMETTKRNVRNTIKQAKRNRMFSAFAL